jgi:hypothetical protein
MIIITNRFDSGDDKVLSFRNISQTNHFDSGVDPGTSKRRARETSNTKRGKYNHNELYVVENTALARPAHDMIDLKI